VKEDEVPPAILEIDAGVGPEAKIAAPVPLNVRLDGMTVLADADPLL
jgi:methyl coenzyme M reductase subunit C-like uncharacterized protein (methanogenesis marker protein 7)